MAFKIRVWANAAALPFKTLSLALTWLVVVPCGAGAGGINGVIPTVRLETKIAPNTPTKDLLPPAPPLSQPLPPWLIKDLSQVPEVFFQKPLQVKGPSSKDIEKRRLERRQQGANDTEIASLAKEENEAKEAEAKVRAQIAQTLANINHLNQKEADYFLTLLMENRDDLAGLPFLKGAACRMSTELGRQFVREVFPAANQFGGGGFGGGGGGFGGQLGGLGGMQVNIFGSPSLKGFGFAGVAGATVPQANSESPPDEVMLVRVAAWMQTSPENTAKRGQIVKTLVASKHAAATGALGKLAVFAPEKAVREAALEALKDRAPEDYTPVLERGLRYPWPEIAKNAADAIVHLNREDLIDQLADFLDEPDPRAPFEDEHNGRKVMTVREVVRLNHHHNCVTCHAPATSDADFNKNGWTTDFVAAHVTIPGQTVTPPEGGFYSSGGPRFPDLAVRVDVTYLRQDFSLLQKVESGMSGKPEERFDFLVRTRAVKERDVKGYNRWRAKQGPDYLSPNHLAALTALRQLTGLDAEPTSAAWRHALLDAEPR